MLLHQRANHAHQNNYQRKINMCVTTSQYNVRNKCKITFAQIKLNPPGHNLPTRHKQTTFCMMLKLKLSHSFCENYTKQAILL